MGPLTSRTAQRIAVLYVCVTAVGLWLGDRLAETSFGRAALPEQFHTLEDWTIILLSGLLIYALLRRELLKQEQAWDELHRSHEELERRVGERTAELSRANEALSRERDGLTSILDAVADGVYVVNQQYNIEYVNPTLVRDFGPVEGRKCYEFFHDRTESCPWCQNDKVFSGQVVRWEWYSPKNQKTYALVDAPVHNEDGTISKLEVFHDISEQKRAQAERERLLLEIDAQRQLFQTVVQNAPAGIVVLDGQDLRARWANAVYLQFLDEPYPHTGISGLRLQQFIPRAEESGVAGIFRAVAETRQPYTSPEFEHLGFARGVTYWRWSLVPLASPGDDRCDLMLLATEITEQVLARQKVEALMAATARRASDWEALVQVRTSELQEAKELLERRVEERTTELSTLLSISRTASSTLQMQPLIDLILDQLKTVVDYSAATIFVPSGEDVIILGYRGSLPQEQVQGFRAPIRQSPLYEALLESHEPIIISELQGDSLLARAYREVAAPPVKLSIGECRSVLGVPLLVKESMIGALRLDHAEPDHFSPDHAQLTLAIGNHVAAAIENARLYEDVRKLAALEERQRLARELHDSVSQALYAIALGTHAAREMYARQSGQVPEALDYVLTQAKAAVDEMRALIFELRPEALAEEGLTAALSKQADALRARCGLAVQTDLCDEPELPNDAEEALYRIAQEALQNIYKHAHASAVELRLYPDQGRYVLEVNDDGRGFDPGQPFPGHVGLKSMHQRAASLGGALDIDSAPGQGTRLRAWIPAAPA